MSSLYLYHRLKYLLHYNPNTGEFTRLVAVGKTAVGDIAGTINGRGYKQIIIDGKKYLSHRLAWLYTHGQWPFQQIDHIDGNPANNRLSNLREATPSENQQNKAKAMFRGPTPLTSRFIGVRKFKRTGKWVAAITAGGKVHHLGYFVTEEMARDAYLKAKSELHTFKTTGARGELMDKQRYEQAREAGRRARQVSKGRDEGPRYGITADDRALREAWTLGWDAEDQERQQRRSAA